MSPWRSRELGTVLRQRRNELGLSTRELGRQAGIDPATVQRIEQGSIANPGTATLEAIAAALGLPLSRVLAAASPQTAATTLPALQPYLRTRYPDLSERQIDELTSYFDFIQARYGAHRPAEGDDER